MIRALLFALSLSLSLLAEVPRTFQSMGEVLLHEQIQLEALQELDTINNAAVEAHAEALQRCFEIGYHLDEAIDANATAAKQLRQAYLSALRGMQKRSGEWQKHYADLLNDAMQMRDSDTFELLVSHPLSVLERPSFKRRALAFYESIRDERTIAAMEVIRDDMHLEERSAAFLATERSAFKKDQQVLTEAQVRQSDRPVLVSAVQQGRRFVFYAENRNIYPVTLTLMMPEMENMRPSKGLPLTVELGAYAKQQMLRLDVVDSRKGAAYASSYGWVMGRLSARHSDPLYRLPFAVGSRVMVSQGVDGGVTHKGLTRFAIDFECPVGTKVYAARGGKVVAAESGHNEGGFDKRYGDKANYIIIEHDDHTLGKYYHLKQYGVMVRVGESVSRGQFIGYSGNTGYSSGPHLHFSVSSVDTASKLLPATLPFRFKAAEGVVAAPKTRDFYTVVRVN